jgi:hypothetical protein
MKDIAGTPTLPTRNIWPTSAIPDEVAVKGFKMAEKGAAARGGGGGACRLVGLGFRAGLGLGLAFRIRV